jgi:hypothetical protein
LLKQGLCNVPIGNCVIGAAKRYAYVVCAAGFDLLIANEAEPHRRQRPQNRSSELEHERMR